MFTRGGVYRVVKEALGGTFAKLSVSALMFDYILTGPISGVSAGQNLPACSMSWCRWRLDHQWLPAAMLGAGHAAPQLPMNGTSAVFAVVVTLYYWWLNLKGIEESSDKALDVMKVTTIMVVILLGWGFYSVFVKGAQLPPAPIPSNLHFSNESLWVPQEHQVQRGFSACSES